MGETNENALQETPSLYFGGTESYAQSEASRNFNGKDITVEVMIEPEETGQDMPIFSHGSDGKKMQLWLTDDMHLKAVVNDVTLVSDSVIHTNSFQQVAMVINHSDSTLHIIGPNFEQKVSNVIS